MKGVLLLNLGGPSNLDEVKPFLYRLFSDPAILVGIPSPFRQGLAFLISQLKASSSRRMYRKIGGGSPQLYWTQKQAEGLEKLLCRKDSQENFSENKFLVKIGMRASSPFIEEALLELKNGGAEEVILFPLFPQFSTTTTGSCFQEVDRLMKKWKWNPVVRKITKWANHPEYISLLIKTIQESLDFNEKTHVLFSAHSLPMAVVKRGDPYLEDVHSTVNAITEQLSPNFSWSLAFQSRNGKLPWLEPYIEDELMRLGKTGVKKVVVVPLSFVSDHIETLWELDQYYFKIAREHGIEKYFRTRTFNDDPEFSQVLYSVLAHAWKN